MADDCAQEMARLQDATDALEESGRDLSEAASDYEDAGGVFDDSTAWDVAGVVGAAAVCLIPAVGWLTCAAAAVAGGGTVLASESGRAQEIAAAEQKLEREWGDYWRAFDRWNRRASEAVGCQLHHRQKQQP